MPDHRGGWGHSTIGGAVDLCEGSRGLECSHSSEIRAWRCGRALAWAFDESLLRTRTLLAACEDMDADDFNHLRRDHPGVSDEIRVV